MTTPRTRFAILGFGHHAVRRLVPAFPIAQRSQLVGLWRRNPDAAAQNAAEFHIPHAFRSREDLCASPEVDAVFITSPDAMHLDDCLLALAHGKAVLCEKPLAMNAAEAEQIRSAAQRSGVLFGVAQNFRWNRSLDWMRDQIRSGKIGTPQLARSEFHYAAQKTPRKWITDPSLANGGPIGDVGVHCLDALRFVLEQDFLSVSTLARRDELSGPVEAVASLQLEMSGHIFATVDTSARTSYRTLLEITGSEGVLIGENAFTVDRPVHLVRRAGGELAEEVTLSNSDGYARMLDAFADAMNGGEPFCATGDDAVHNMRVLDSSYRSWHTGKREPV